MAQHYSHVNMYRLEESFTKKIWDYKVGTKALLTNSSTYKKTQRVICHRKKKQEKIIFFIYYSSRTTQLNWKQKSIAVSGIPWRRKTAKVEMYL